MREDYGLILDLRFRLVAVLTGEHIDLALIHTELADISLQEEDVSALHANSGFPYMDEVSFFMCWVTFVTCVT